MKFDKNLIDPSVTTVEEAIIYLSLCLGEGEVNESKLNKKNYIEAITKFKLKSTSSSVGIWKRTEEFKNVPFRPYSPLPSVGIPLAVIPPPPIPRFEQSKISCSNTAMQPRNQTNLNLIIQSNFIDCYIELQTNTPYVWDRFDFTAGIRSGLTDLTLNADKSTIRFTTTQLISNLSLQTVDTNDPQNFHFPLMLVNPQGKSIEGQNLLIINMSNEYPVIYKPDLTRFDVAGRTWVLDRDLDYNCYVVNSTCLNNAERDYLKTATVTLKLQNKLQSILGVPIKKLPLEFGLNPRLMFRRSGYRLPYSIEFLFTEA